jgi:type II secretory pathway component GspD/PulD (secretin)
MNSVCWAQVRAANQTDIEPGQQPSLPSYDLSPAAPAVAQPSSAGQTAVAQPEVVTPAKAQPKQEDPSSLPLTSAPLAMPPPSGSAPAAPAVAQPLSAGQTAVAPPKDKSSQPAVVTPAKAQPQQKESSSSIQTPAPLAMPQPPGSVPAAPAAAQPLSAGQTAVAPPFDPVQPVIIQPGFPQLQPAASLSPRRGLFALNFDDADLYTIIQTVFGEILKVNYVVDPRVKGRVTFRAISPVPAENVLPLMEVILRLNGIGVVEDSGLYRIVPISDISKEPSPVSYGRDPEKIPTTGKALLQVVPITYIHSAEALKLITPFASNNAVLIDVPKGNQIIIVDTDANVKRMLKLIDVFDNEKLKRRKPQIFVYQVQNSKAKDIASLLQQVFQGTKGGITDQPSRAGGGTPAASPLTPPGYPGSTQSQASTTSASGEMLISDSTKIIPDEITNTIIILSTPEDYAAIRETITQIDIVPRQVVIDGMVADVILTDNLSFGLGALFTGTISNLNTTYALNPISLNVNPVSLTTSGFTFVGVDSAGIVRAAITALARESKAKVLAAPHILVSDNRDAKIQVGQQVPLLTSETYGTPGVSPQRNFQYRDIGIILKVKPRINEGGLVSLEIYQEISSTDTFKLNGDDQLLINKTDASTNLVVQDGQTIVIGGLIREDATKSRDGIPFLSKIPILGWLFGSTTDNSTRREVIILLTPHVIKNQKEAKAMSSEYIDKMTESSEGRIKKEDLIKEKQRKKEGGKPAEAPGNKLQESP